MYEVSDSSNYTHPRSQDPIDAPQPYNEGQNLPEQEDIDRDEQQNQVLKGGGHSILG